MLTNHIKSYALSLFAIMMLLSLSGRAALGEDDVLGEEELPGGALTEGAAIATDGTIQVLPLSPADEEESVTEYLSEMNAATLKLGVKEAKMADAAFKNFITKAKIGTKVYIGDIHKSLGAILGSKCPSLIKGKVLTIDLVWTGAWKYTGRSTWPPFAGTREECKYTGHFVGPIPVTKQFGAKAPGTFNVVVTMKISGFNTTGNVGKNVKPWSVIK